MAARESRPPASLAQIIARRAGRSDSGPSSHSEGRDSTPPGGQFGFLFAEAEVLADAVPAEAEPDDGWTVAKEPPRPKSVSELVSELRGRVENAYPDAWVAGEVSNCRPAASGHVYFTLKDADSQLPAVLFRRNASLLRFRLEDGIAVLARGRVSVFEQRGQLQLIAESLELRGAGALQLAFEQLKAKLRAEGLFDADRKRPLPPFPRTIGVVTSMQGAVIRDIVTVCRRRHICLNIKVYPAAVQGPTCPTDVIAGLRYFNRSERHPVDVIVLARGGGAAEDLWGFNNEALARAIAESEVPVVSAIGHETDYTIADFVADLRAPTPSAAAELITSAQHRVEDTLHSLHARLLRAVRFQQMLAKQRFSAISANAVFARMHDALGRRSQRVDANRFRLEAAIAADLRSRTERLERSRTSLARLDVHRRVLAGRASLQGLQGRLLRTGPAAVQPWRERLRSADIQLQALSPLAALQRGYALIYTGKGELLRSAGQVAPGELITAHLATGAVSSRVTEVHTVRTGQNPARNDRS